MISYALIVSFGVWGMPQLLVRFYSIKSVDVLRIGTVVTSLGGSMALLPYLDGAIARVLHPGLTNADLAIPTLAKTVLSPWGGAIFLAGVIAAGMSTFASVLIITSSAIVHDFAQKGLGKPLSEKQAFRYSRITSAVVGLFSLGSPFGLHGFIPRTAIGLIVLLLVSRFTRKLSVEHLAWVWGENRPSSTKGRVSPSLR